MTPNEKAIEALDKAYWNALHGKMESVKTFILEAATSLKSVEHDQQGLVEAGDAMAQFIEDKFDDVDLFATAQCVAYWNAAKARSSAGQGKALSDEEIERIVELPTLYGKGPFATPTKDQFDHACACLRYARDHNLLSHVEQRVDIDGVMDVIEDVIGEGSQCDLLRDRLKALFSQ